MLWDLVSSHEKAVDFQAFFRKSSFFGRQSYKHVNSIIPKSEKGTQFETLQVEVAKFSALNFEFSIASIMYQRRLRQNFAAKNRGKNPFST